VSSYKTERATTSFTVVIREVHPFPSEHGVKPRRAMILTGNVWEVGTAGLN